MFAGGSLQQSTENRDFGNLGKEARKQCLNARLIEVFGELCRIFRFRNDYGQKLFQRRHLLKSRPEVAIKDVNRVGFAFNKTVNDLVGNLGGQFLGGSSQNIEVAVRDLRSPPPKIIRALAPDQNEMDLFAGAFPANERLSSTAQLGV